MLAGYGQYGIALSWSLPELTLFIYSYSTDKLYSDTIADNIRSDFDDIEEWDTGISVNIELVRNLLIWNDEYLSESDSLAVRNHFLQQPMYRDFIGWDGEQNANVTVAEAQETIEYKDYGNLVRWTAVNQMNFNPLYFVKLRSPFLRMIPAPGFLQDEYRNTVLIFTRNEIYRFVMSGSPDNWSGSTENMIEENTRYGLLAPKTLLRAGETLYWLSEQGLMEWGPGGMKNLTRNIISFTRDENAVAVYDPVNEQVIVRITGT